MRRLMEEGYAEMEQINNKTNEDYLRGVDAGIKQMMDKIQKHCELGKPVMADGELFFFKTARQNLIDIMDDIDAEYGIEKENKYIVPISRKHGEGIDKREIVIKANNAEAAMFIAIRDLECNDWFNPWIVGKDYKHYKQLE